MRISLVNIVAVLLLSCPFAIAGDYSQKLTNIYMPGGSDGVELVRPGESVTCSFTLPDAGMPVRTTLRVAGNVLLPPPYTKRGEDLFRRSATILDDNLDASVHWKDSCSLYFKGQNDDFERIACTRVRLWEMGRGKLRIDIPVARAEGLAIGEGGRFGVELGIYYRKTGRHPLDVFDNPDSIIFVPIPQGTYSRRMIKVEMDVPENAASLVLTVGGRRFSGECNVEAPFFIRGGKTLWHRPFERRVVDAEGFSFKDIDYRTEETDYWVSMNMSERSWPYWKIEFNGKIVREGKIFDRSSNVSDFYVTLPSQAACGGNLRLTLVDEPHRWSHPYQLRRLDIITEPARDIEIISVPKFVAAGNGFGVLVETNAPDQTLTVVADSAISPSLQNVTFRECGLHVLRFKALHPAASQKISVSNASLTLEGKVEHIVVKGQDGVFLSSGDDVYIDKTEEDYPRYFKWYVSSRVGNHLQFRPSYQWSGLRKPSDAFLEKYTSLLCDLEMPYAWQVEGRTPAGKDLNPPTQKLQTPFFRGKQAHENDGGYYYWTQFRYQGFQTDMEARTRPYGGIYAKKRPEFTPHGAFVHYDREYVEDMAMGADYFVNNLRGSKGESTRHTGPSTMFRYFYKAGYDWVGAEQFYGPEETIMSSLRGASRAYSKPLFGSLHAIQWGVQPFTATYHPLIHYMSLAVAYMQGSSHINTEEGLWTDEYLNDRYTESGAAHLKVHNDMLDFIQTHTRRGALHTRIGVIQGRNDPWKCFNRGPMWSQDGEKWAFGQANGSFDLLKVFYPDNDMDYCHDKEHMFTRTPFGPVDIFPVEAPLEQMNGYGLIVFLGWNTYCRDDFERLEKFVAGGGTLILTEAHLNSCLQPDLKPEFPSDDAPLRLLLGNDYRNLKGKVTLPHGLGKVIYYASGVYPSSPSICEDYRSEMQIQAACAVKEEGGRGWIECGDRVDFTPWDDGALRTIYLLHSRWAHPEPASCRFIYGKAGYELSIEAGRISFIHCSEGIAVRPSSNTSDVLSIKKTSRGWDITVQTTGEDVLTIYFKDRSRVEKRTVDTPGIHKLSVKI